MVTGPLPGEMRGLCHWIPGCLALVSGHMLLNKVFGSLLPFPQTELSPDSVSPKTTWMSQLLGAWLEPFPRG